MISCNHRTKENRSSSFYLICLLHLAPLDMTFCYRDWNNGLESVGMFFCDLNRTCHLVVSLLILTGPTPQRDIRGSGVASIDNWRGEYSYIRVHRP